MKLLSLDFETSINKTIHGPTFRDPENDLYTQIWATDEQWCGVVHAEKGFKRTLYDRIEEELLYCDYLIGHNISFDLCFVWHTEAIRKFILRGGIIWDTQSVEYTLTGQQHAFSSLAELQLKHLGEVEKPSRISRLYKKGIGADKIVQARRRCPRLFKLYEHYCQTDGVTPLKIFKKQYEIAVKEGMLAAVELDNDYLFGLINTTVSGIHVDIVQCEKTYRDFELKHLELLAEAQGILKQYWTDPRLPEFKINSPDHKSAVLFGGFVKCNVKEFIGYFKPKPIYEQIEGTTRRKIIGHEEPIKKYKKAEIRVRVDGFGVPTRLSSESKKSGVYVTDVNIMQKIEAGTKNAELKRYCELQKSSMMYKKAAKTYCKAFIDRSVNGVLYPVFNNTTTITGRLSSKDPNMQNVSKRNEFGKILHSLFIAPPGWVCVEIDFNQLEIWVLAMLSKDPQLISDLLSGIDMHCMRLQYYNTDKTYEEIYKLCREDKDEYWEKQRDAAKTTSYRKAYGAGVATVAAATGLAEEVVRTIFNKEDEKYVEAANFPKLVREELEENNKISVLLDIPNAYKGTNKDSIHSYNGYELVPKFDMDGNIGYNNKDLRRVGYYQGITGHRWAFTDTMRETKWGWKRQFGYTETMNYPMQGTAAKIQGASTAEIFRVLVKKMDRIQMINEVHDSKWFYVREDVLAPCLKWLKEVIEDIPTIFGRRFNIDVPFKFPVGIKIGPNFGNMEKYE